MEVTASTHWSKSFSLPSRVTAHSLKTAILFQVALTFIDTLALLVFLIHLTVFEKTVMTLLTPLICKIPY